MNLNPHFTTYSFKTDLNVKQENNQLSEQNKRKICDFQIARVLKYNTKGMIYRREKLIELHQN